MTDEMFWIAIHVPINRKKQSLLRSPLEGKWGRAQILSRKKTCVINEVVFSEIMVLTLYRYFTRHRTFTDSDKFRKLINLDEHDLLAVVLFFLSFQLIFKI